MSKIDNLTSLLSTKENIVKIDKLIELLNTLPLDNFDDQFKCADKAYELSVAY